MPDLIKALDLAARKLGDLTCAAGLALLDGRNTHNVADCWEIVDPRASQARIQANTRLMGEVIAMVNSKKQNGDKTGKSRGSKKKMLQSSPQRASSMDKCELVGMEESELMKLAEALEKAEAFGYTLPKPMWSRIFDNSKEAEKLTGMTLSAMMKSFINEKNEEAWLHRILGEMILGAYQDRMVAYSINPSGMSSDSTEAMEGIQRIRHKADLHLIRVIQAFKDIKRPPVNIVVKQADQVNVGEKQMNVDKQVNVSSDLDKK